MLTVNNLVIASRQAAIVKGMTFDISEKKITAIIGESGSGKSMTVLALLGMVPAGLQVTGDILYRQKNICLASEKEWSELRQRIFFTIFQDAANSFNANVKMDRQLFAFSAGRIGDDWTVFIAKMAPIMERLGLSPLILQQYPFELSGGMLQRCMIACALYVEPEILIADEPTSALDRVRQKEFLRLLSELNEEKGTTVLLVTHDLDMIMGVADEVLVMEKGRLVEKGDGTRIFNQPEHPYTKKLLESRFS